MLIIWLFECILLVFHSPYEVICKSAAQLHRRRGYKMYNRYRSRCVRKSAKNDNLLRSVRLSVRPHGIDRTPIDIHKNLYLSIFQKYVHEIETWLKSDKNKG
jgi:hypothetical protein